MPEYISGRQRKLNVGIRSYSENTDTVKVIGNVLVSSGNIGVGITDPTQDIDVNTLRVRDTIYDYTNYGGALGYYLVKDTGGLKWVAVPPIDSNAIFIAENNNILGVSSFTGLNIISDELIGVSSNPINPNFADIKIVPRWLKSGETGIYTTKNVGIGTTIPLADFQVGFGTTGVTIDGSSGVVSAIGYYGNFAILNNLFVNGISTVAISSVLNQLNVVGLGTTFVSVYLASAGGITTTGGDLYVGGVLYADNIEIEDISVDNINISGIATINTAEINNLVSVAATITTLSVESGDINNLVSTASTITTLSGTDLSYSGISTLNTIDVIEADIDNLRTQNIFNSGIITTNNLNVQSGFDVYADTSVFHDNVIIQGNLTVNGTEVIINVDEKYIKDKQIILGYSTTNNVNDTTANGGGIAIASTEGNPLVSLFAVGVNTIPDTYKQLIWAKSNTYGVGTTDAFLFNYAVGIGSTLVPNGVRLAVGGVQVTDDTINVEYINSGIGTVIILDVNSASIDNIIGSAATITNFNSSNIIGSAASIVNLVGTAATVSSLVSSNLVSTASSFITLNVLGISTFNNGPVLIGTGNSTGTINQRLQVTGDSYFSGNIGLGTTNPTRKLDVLGDVRLRGQILDRFNNPGTQGSVLTSDPLTDSWYWAEPPPFVIGILTASDDVVYYPTLRLIGNDGSNGIGSAGYLQVDNAFNSGFAYKINPARLGIGTTNPQFNLDVYGNGRFTGSVNIANNVTAFGATFTNLNVDFARIGYTTGIGASYTGIVTASSFVGNLTGTATSAQSLVGVPNLNVGIVTAIEYYGIFKGTIDPIVTLEYANRAGVATYAVNSGVATYASVAGVATYASVAGVATYAVNSGISTNVIGGIASVSQLRVNGISTFVNGPVLIGTATSTGTSNQILQVSGNSYISGNLGVGSTNPQYKVDITGNTRILGNLYVNDVITNAADTEQIILTSSGFLTTTSLVPVTVDSFGITSYRSAKYVVQITSNNTLGIGTTTSIKNLTRGLNYNPGVYSNVSLISSTGVGTNAVATITVLPQFTLGITTCLAGTFTFTGSAVGMATGQTLTFNQTLNILPLEQSKLTGIQLNSSGFGYTTIPTITVQAPTIAGNTVPGVGVGSTALAVVSSMNVQNAIINVGIATTVIPTVTFSGPSVGTTATGIVGVGVSSISVVNVGSGYTVSPTISIPKVTGFAGSVGLGISSLNWQTTSGSGYTLPTITVDGVNGIGTGAIIEADVDSNAPNGLINFRITNVGFGYTRPPLVTITDSTGVGAAVTITRMTVSNVVVNNIGSGSTTSIVFSDIFLSGGIFVPNFSNVSLLLKGDGVNGSTTIIDNSPSPLTLGFSNPSNAYISTTESKFGGSSFYFNGNSGGFITGTANNQLWFGTEDFTIDFFVRRIGHPNIYQVMVSIFCDGGPAAPVGYGWAVYLTTDYRFAASIHNNNTSVPTAVESSIVAVPGQWYHIAFVRNGTNLTLYIDGTSVATNTVPIGFNVAPNTLTPLNIGTYGNRGFFNSFGGYIDDLVITKGIALYTSNFTPRTKSFLDSAVLAASSIAPTNVVITNVGSGYTIGNIPVTATFSNPSIGATVGLGVGVVTVTSPGIGYTVLPTLTFSAPTLGIGSTATGSSNKLGYDQTALFNGPGLAGTTAVYYVQPLTSNTFGISTVSGGPRINLGYGVTPSTTRASIGGTISTVDITFGGSGYAVDNIITATNFDLPRVDTNVGTGFSFRVNATVNAFQISDLLVLQTASGGNPNAFVIESGGISDASDLGEFSADISANSARLRFTPVYANNEIKFFKTLFRI